MKTPINNNIDKLFNKAKANDQDLDDFEKEAMAGFDMLASKEEANELKTALDERINKELFIKKESHNPKVYWLAAAGLALIIGLSTLFILNDSNSISKTNDLAITDTKKETLPGNATELNEQAASPLETLSLAEKAPAQEVMDTKGSVTKKVADEETTKTPKEAKGPTARMILAPSTVSRSENQKAETKQAPNEDGEGFASSADQTVRLDDVVKTSGSKDKESDAFKAVPSSAQQSQSPKLAESETKAKDEIAFENKNTKGKSDFNAPDADSKKNLNQVTSGKAYGGAVNKEEKPSKEKSKKTRVKSDSNIGAPESIDNEPGAPVTTKAAGETIATPNDDKRDENNFINCYYLGGEGAIIKDIKEKLIPENLDQKFDVTLFINESKTVTKVEFTNAYDLTKKQKEDVTKILKTLNKFNFFVSPTKKSEFTYKVAYRP